MKYKLLFPLLFLFVCVKAQQRDSLATVTVTAKDRSSFKADNVIDAGRIVMPLQVVDKKTIALLGSSRLDEVLREQTGLAVVSDLGAGNRSVGLQMQGFSSEYITVLIDGQPMAGRNNGSFDLSRISISGIERIEIIKGASSSLYGSEALGGVINIITRQYVSHRQAVSYLSYGANGTLDASIDAASPFSRGAAYLTGSYYRTDGFNVNPYLEKGSQTAPPYNSAGLQGRVNYRLNDVSTLYVSGRFAGRHSIMTRDYGVRPSKDGLDENDLNGMISLDNHFAGGARLIGRYYLTRYHSLQKVYLPHDGSLLQSDNYTEYVHRMEVQASRDLWNKKLSVIGGAGGEHQSVNAASQGASGHFYNYFGFVQGHYDPVVKVGLTGGVRYDGNTLYGGRLNPSVGLRYAPFSWITLKGGMGKGYRSPSYRQLYQVFTNILQGYTVIGANTFAEGVKELQASGLIEQVWPVASQVKDLRPETSTSFNIGWELTPVAGLKIDLSAFYNTIHNLINTQQMGIKTNGSQLFSYVNIARAYTKGIEAGVRVQPLKELLITGGYQLLYAKDRGVIDSISVRAAQYDSVRSFPSPRPSSSSDYFGLPNRSRHMANLHVFYSIRRPAVDVSLRAIYRGKAGFLDTDNNGFIDPYDVFIKGYVLVNASLRKRLLKDRLTLQLTFDNIGNHTDYLMPAQPGRTIMAGVAWQFSGKKQNTDQ
jgi:outer membrane receptor for ferrienterochelin and colicins